MMQERHKRALPARHSFLTDAVSTVLETSSKTQVPQIDCQTILKLTKDLSNCTDFGEPEPIPLPSSDIQPVFRIISQKRPTKAKSSSDITTSDDYYLARHRKHEMEEKKQKNREKERLEHGLYQQQQLVERLKTMDKSTLASIVSSLRPLQSNDSPSQETRQPYTSMTPMDLERLHQILLQDAREQMYRYEKLGLGRKRGQGFINTRGSAARIKELETKVLAHFKQQGQHRPEGKRRSLRTGIAFGEKLPAMDTVDFELPDEVFGTMISRRK
ncbi:uncharacterized protein BX664DRAFT_385241 [Halteromyces radiatus]|uniref:uncharacterized protein n=1 Tax=Halteromyces radiatus TaxID=101107 RepID=UPI00221FFB4B|nr:uncharacterized protein BX664DRAFT_385241 [Halteromyces radiatus]KAI8093902.1 hypothetical protein BX664DRAFT_385241 [Halteromyces radiatus]